MIERMRTQSGQGVFARAEHGREEALALQRDATQQSAISNLVDARQQHARKSTDFCWCCGCAGLIGWRLNRRFDDIRSRAVPIVTTIDKREAMEHDVWKQIACVRTLSDGRAQRD